MSNIYKVENNHSDLINTILPLLLDKVFHVTNYESYKSILKSGSINFNEDNKYTYNFTQSAISFGVKNKMVCLIDLRQINHSEAKEYAGNGYYFLQPKTDWRVVVFLILSSKFYDNLKVQGQISFPYTDWHVPNIECWYPGSIGLEKISEVIIVNIS